jgi:hypothetical protein
VEASCDQHRGVQGFTGALALACSGVLGLGACGNDDAGAHGPGAGAATGGAVATGGNAVAGNATAGSGAGTGGSAQGAGAPSGGVANHGGATNGGANTSGASTGGGSAGTPSGGAGPGGAQAFPASSPFYQDISKAKLDDQSATLIAALDAIGWGDVGKRTTLGIDFSFNINTADAGLAPRAFTKAPGFYSPDCDTAPVPLPPGGKGEGVNDYACSGGDDCHLFVYQSTRLFELYQSNITGGAASGGTFSAKCLVVWDLTKDYWVAKAPPNFSRGDGCTGADAAGLPMAPLVLTKQDIASGAIKHALRFTIDNNRIAETVYVHPATHLGGPTGGPNMLPYGARLRLRGNYDLAGLPNAHARTVAKALQTYGMYLSDGGNIYVSATTDAADLINNSILAALEPSDFEMVDGGARIDAGSQDCKHVPITQ